MTLFQAYSDGQLSHEAESLGKLSDAIAESWYEHWCEFKVAPTMDRLVEVGEDDTEIELDEITNFNDAILDQLKAIHHEGS